MTNGQLIAAVAKQIAVVSQLLRTIGSKDQRRPRLELELSKLKDRRKALETK